MSKITVEDFTFHGHEFVHSTMEWPDKKLELVDILARFVENMITDLVEDIGLDKFQDFYLDKKE